MRRREGERKWEKHWCVRETSSVAYCMPQPGTWATTQACNLTGNWTSSLLVCRMMLSPLSHTSQGFACFRYTLPNCPPEMLDQFWLSLTVHSRAPCNTSLYYNDNWVYTTLLIFPNLIGQEKCHFKIHVFVKSYRFLVETLRDTLRRVKVQERLPLKRRRRDKNI